jgi:hypothetical protein
MVFLLIVIVLIPLTGVGIEERVLFLIFYI